MSDTDNHTQTSSYLAPINQAQHQLGQPAEQRSHVALNFNAKGLAQPDIKLYFSTPDEALVRGPELLEAILNDLTRRFPTVLGDWQPRMSQADIDEVLFEADGRMSGWRAE